MADVPTNKEQNEVSGRILEGHHVLITGQAGSGKTQTLKTVFKDLKFLQKDVALLCTTGMGCLQFIDLGATTVHRWWRIISSGISSQRNKEVNISLIKKIYSFFTATSDPVLHNETTLQQIYRTVDNFFTVKSETCPGSETVLQKICRSVESYFTAASETRLGSETVLQQIYTTIENFFTIKRETGLPSETVLQKIYRAVDSISTATSGLFTSTVLHCLVFACLVFVLISFWWNYQNHDYPDTKRTWATKNSRCKPKHGLEGTSREERESHNGEERAAHVPSLDSGSLTPASFTTAICTDSPTDRSVTSSGSSPLDSSVVSSRLGDSYLRRLSTSSTSTSSSSSGLPLGPTYSVGHFISAGKLEVLSVLGRGSQGAIYKVTNGAATYAAKLSHLRGISLDLITEFDVLFGLDHPNVIKVHQKIPRGFLMECLHQNLASFIDSCHGIHDPLNRDRLAFGILQGLSYIHDCGIAHLDIKPGNILLTSAGVPKLADFGLALRYHRDDGSVRIIDTNRGTPQYAAPEMFRPDPIRNISKCDCWSTGVTLFVLMAGKVLFDGNTPAEIYRNMVNGHYGYPSHLKNITPRQKNYFVYMEMVKGLCRVDPGSRLTALQALMHECFL